MAQYVTEGPVRGRCPHVHRSIEAAHRCAMRDQAGCAAQGGYSDRGVRRLVDGRAELLDEAGYRYLESLED